MLIPHRQSELEVRLQGSNSDQSRQQLWASAGKLEGKYLRFLRTPNRIDDYETIKTIGKGAFGEVKLVRRKHDARVYALKSLLKTKMIAQAQLSRVRAERDILAEVESHCMFTIETLCIDGADSEFRGGKASHDVSRRQVFVHAYGVFAWW